MFYIPFQIIKGEIKMNKFKLSMACLMIMSLDIVAEEKQHIEVQSVRGILGDYDLLEHTQGQLRAGYIGFAENTLAQTDGFALGGHYHLNTKEYYGLKIGAEVYTVLNLAINQKSINENSDFFDKNSKSFLLLTQAYLSGKWANTEIKLGRQTLDTPHADSDDIRMMPNYFEAYTMTNTDIDNLTLSVGMIDKMAGWENGIDSPKFVDVGETLGVHKIDGIYYASASYEGVKNLSVALWYYHYSDIANILYAEAGYNIALTSTNTLTLGLQYDQSQESGSALLGKQDAQTFGLNLEAKFDTLGITLLAAYNEDNSDTGAMPLSLGGGALFTSMEDQTLDAMGTQGSAWVVGAGYNFKANTNHDFTFGIAYGHFEAKDDSVYKVNEIDAILEYAFKEKITISTAFALVDFKVKDMNDYKQFRVIGSYNF